MHAEKNTHLHAKKNVWQIAKSSLTLNSLRTLDPAIKSLSYFFKVSFKNLLKIYTHSLTRIQNKILGSICVSFGVFDINRFSLYIFLTEWTMASNTN